MSQRKRAAHFALMDTAFAADRKFVRLARKATIPIEYAAAVGVFWLLLADARRSKCADVDWSEYEEYEPQLQLLREVGLLTDTGFPAGPFDAWAPAYRSPSDAARGTQRDAGVRRSTHRDDVSIQFSSIRGEGGAGEAGLFNGVGTHDGRHGPGCAVCFPATPRPRAVPD